MSPAQRLLLAALGATLGSCAGRTVPRTNSGLSPMRSLLVDAGPAGPVRDVMSRIASASPPARPFARIEGRWRAYLLEPLRGEVRREGIEADGTYYAVFGGARLRVRPGTYSWAPDLVLGGIATVARSANGWLFAGADGALYRAQYFTAPLERVGTTDGVPIESGYISTGRLSARDQRGQLWIGAQDGFRRWSAPERSALLDAGFVDDRFGVALVSPGRLFRTTDGGARWEPLDLQGRGAYEVLPESDGFIVRAPEGLFRAEATGPLAPFAGIALPSEHTVSDAAAVRAAAGLEAPAARAALIGQSSIVLAPDRLYYAPGYRAPSDRFGSLQRQVTYAGDDLWLAVPNQPPTHVDAPSSQCRYYPWGARLLGFCRDPRTSYQVALFAGDGLGPWSPVTVPSTLSLWGTFATSVDGRGVWAFSACDSGSRTANQSWCRFDGARWSTLDVERRAQYVASYGDLVAYRMPEGVFEQGIPGPLRVQLASEPASSARPPRRSDPRARIVTGAFTQDGTFFARATVEDDAMLAIGSLTGELAIRPLPTGALDVAMADANRGLAAGDRLDRVWTTEDGGLTWRPLELPLRGSAQAIALPAESSESEVRVRCTAHACSVSDRLTWTSETLVGEPPPVVHSAPRVQPYEPADERAARRPAPTRELDFGVTRCVPITPPPASAEHQFGAGGWFRFLPPGVEWGGRDARGFFRASTRDAFPLQDSPPNWGAALWRYAPRYVSRALTLVERCSFQSSYGGAARPRQCDLVALTPNHPPRVWLTPRNAAPGLSLSNGSAPRVAELVALRDNTFALRITSSLLDETAVQRAGDPTADMILRVDANGTIVERKSFAWGRSEHRMRALAFDGARLGLIVLPRDASELRFYTSSADAGRTRATAPPRLRPCGEPRPDVAFMVSSANEHNASVRGGSAVTGLRLFRGEDGVQTTVELGPSGVCIRRITAGTSAHTNHPPSETAQSIGGALTLEAQAGELRGQSLIPGRTVAMDCVPDVAPR